MYICVYKPNTLDFTLLSYNWHNLHYMHSWNDKEKQNTNIWVIVRKKNIYIYKTIIWRKKNEMWKRRKKENNEKWKIIIEKLLPSKKRDSLNLVCTWDS